MRTRSIRIGQVRHSVVGNEDSEGYFNESETYNHGLKCIQKREDSDDGDFESDGSSDG